jgi:arylformamidase
LNTNIEFLEREYNPRTQIANVAEFFERWKKQGQEARASLRSRLNLAYGASTGETLDYFPAATANSPILIFVHGGYWRAFDKTDFSWVAPGYVAAGISVAVLNYGLAPATPIREIVQQIRRACAWVFDNADSLGVDRRRIFCAGHSAGGHLTAMMLATEWPALSPGLPPRLLAGAFSISGLFDLVPLAHAEFLRKDLGLDDEGARALSPASLELRDGAPLLRAVGALESGEFHRQSHLIASHWPSACKAELIDVPGRNHLSVCDAFAMPGAVLFDAVRGAIQPLGDSGRRVRAS